MLYSEHWNLLNALKTWKQNRKLKLGDKSVHSHVRLKKWGIIGKTAPIKQRI